MVWRGGGGGDVTVTVTDVLSCREAAVCSPAYACVGV